MNFTSGAKYCFANQGEGGGLAHVRAIGVILKSRGIAQRIDKSD